MTEHEFRVFVELKEKLDSRINDLAVLAQGLWNVAGSYTEFEIETDLLLRYEEYYHGDTNYSWVGLPFSIIWSETPYDDMCKVRAERAQLAAKENQKRQAERAAMQRQQELSYYEKFIV